MPSTGVNLYPTVEDVLETARSESNDAILSLGGDILADNQPYIMPLMQACYRNLQRRLRRPGVNTFKAYEYALNLLPVQNPGGVADTTIQVQLTYTGYFDGVQQHQNPTLPPDMLEPLEVWERQNGSVDAWTPVMQAANNIPTLVQTYRFRYWDWESDTLYFPGATIARDIKIEYLKMLPTLTDVNSPVLIVDCQDTMAMLLLEKVAKMRGGVEMAAVFKQEAENEMQLLIAPTATKEQYASFHRKPFRGRGRRWAR